MDLKQAEYIVAIAQEKNITRAAEKMFLTQSALNQQLLKLERELGSQLFFRSRTNWRPTTAGEIYLRSAREMLRMKRDTYQAIRDIAEKQVGELSVGFTPGRGIAMFTQVYPRFHALNPEITVTPVEMGVKRQLDRLLQGDLDLGFLTVRRDAIPNIRCSRIWEEPIVLAVPNRHSLAERAGGEATVAELEALREEPFVVIDKESSLRPITDGIFDTMGFQPRILFETASNSAIASMVKAGICCAVLPLYYVREQSEPLAWLTLPGNPAWHIVGAYRSGRYLSRAAKQFLELAGNYWQDLYSDFG